MWTARAWMALARLAHVKLRASLNRCSRQGAERLPDCPERGLRKLWWVPLPPVLGGLQRRSRDVVGHATGWPRQAQAEPWHRLPPRRGAPPVPAAARCGSEPGEVVGGCFERVAAPVTSEPPRSAGPACWTESRPAQGPAAADKRGRPSPWRGGRPENGQ
jgi:hypothetical protein